MDCHIYCHVEIWFKFLYIIGDSNIIVFTMIFKKSSHAPKGPRMQMRGKIAPWWKPPTFSSRFVPSWTAAAWKICSTSIIQIF